MKLPSLPAEDGSGGPKGNDGITAATERLFVEIADAFDDPNFQRCIRVANADLYATRRYESAFIGDLDAEYAALSECWNARDIPRLRILLAAYFRRRRELSPEIEKLIDRPN